MSDGRFEGWYYKQRTGDYMLAFIPGRAADGPFVQMIDSNGTRRFAMPDFHVRGDTVRTGGCVFSPAGLRIRLPGVTGDLRYDRAVEHARDRPENPGVLRLRVPPRTERPEQIYRRGHEPVDAADRADDAVLPLARPDIIALFEQAVHRRPVHAAMDKHRAADARQHKQQADRPDIQQVRPIEADGNEQRHCRQDAQHRARDLAACVARRKRRPALAHHVGHAGSRRKRFGLQKSVCFHLRGTRDEHRHRGRHQHQQHAQADACRRMFRNGRARPVTERGEQKQRHRREHAQQRRRRELRRSRLPQRQIVRRLLHGHAAQRRVRLGRGGFRLAELFF